MDRDEQLQFLARARSIVGELKAWCDEQNESGRGATSAEREVLDQLKSQLEELKHVVKKL
jgi:hypothetical protein